MGQQHIYLAAYGNGYDYEKTRGCHNTHDGGVYDAWYDHCEGDFAVGEQKPCSGCRTRIRCIQACGDNVRHTKTRAGHPCKGATSIKGIPINITNRGGGGDVAGLRDQFPDSDKPEKAPGAFDCTFDIDAQVLKEWSDDPTRDLSRGCGKSAYEQALFGVDGTCESDTTDDAFCAQAENLAKIVDRNGDTCFDKLQEKGKQATAAQQGRAFCENKPEDEKCTCINLAKNYNGGGYIEYCKAHPDHAGCEEINEELLKYKLAGITESLHSTIGPATCLMPNACTDDQYLPINGKIETCRNQIAICDQLVKFEEGASVFAMGDIYKSQNCEIEFNGQSFNQAIRNVCQEDESGACTQGAPLRDTAPRLGDGTAGDINPPGDDDAFVFDNETKKATALGVGGVSIASAFLCMFASMALFAAS